MSTAPTHQRPLSASERRHMALRIPEADLAIIDQLANDHRMTPTEYMIRASTGELADPTDQPSTTGSSNA